MLTQKDIPDCDIRFAIGWPSRVIILRVRGGVISVVSDGKFQGWSPRLVRRAHKRGLLDERDKQLWSEVIERVEPAPHRFEDLSDAHQESFRRLMENDVRLKLTGVKRQGWTFGPRRVFTRTRVILELFRPRRAPRWEAVREALVVRVYRAPIGNLIEP